MGRPRKDGMDYFPHDVDASQDEKIEAMRSMYGNDGYAFYFIILERIYRSGHVGLDISKDIYIHAIANKIMISIERFHDMVRASIDLGLFDEFQYLEHQILTSSGIIKRYEQINLMRDKWRNTKQDKGSSFLDGKQGGKPRGKLVEKGVEKYTKESKGKESKGKESKVYKNIYTDYVSMTQSEYDKLVEQFGEEYTKMCIDELTNYKGANNKKYQSDYRAILSWVTSRVDEKMSRQNQSKRKHETSKPKMNVVYQAPDETFDDDELIDVEELVRKLDSFGS